MKRFLVLWSVILFFGLASNAGAIPRLGVAPAVSQLGIYYGDYDEEEDAYLAYFADEFIPFEGDPGFMVPASGGSLTVWYGANNGRVDGDADIYLVTNSAAGGSFSFNGSGFDPAMDKNGIFKNKKNKKDKKDKSDKFPAVPEPATMLLVGSGLIGLAALGREKFFKKS